MTAEEIKNADLKDLLRLGDFECSCGKKHSQARTASSSRPPNTSRYPAPDVNTSFGTP